MSLTEVKQAILAWSINCVTNNVSLGLINENYWVDRNAGLTHSRNTKKLTQIFHELIN